MYGFDQPQWQQPVSFFDHYFARTANTTYEHYGFRRFADPQLDWKFSGKARVAFTDHSAKLTTFARVDRRPARIDQYQMKSD